MSGFSADWLSLRASADTRARDPALAARLGTHFAGRRALRVLDLGAGSGANLRATAGLIDAPQHWVLADNDAALLACAEPMPNTTVELRKVDLAAGVAGLLDPAPDLLTASAFFDLCGHEWTGRLAEAAADCSAALYAVLTCDGRDDWSPPHPLDADVLTAYRADQKRDKGMGPALGPDAHAYVAGSLRGHGYRVFEAPSDWRLAQPADTGLIAAITQMMAAAVSETVGAERAKTWRTARISAQGVSIGHHDLLALPPE